MKKTIASFAATLFIAGAIFINCQSPDKKAEKAREDLIEANQNLDQALSDSIEQYKNESAIIIINYEKSIADLKVKIKSSKKESKAKYEKMLADLEQKNDNLKKKLKVYKNEGQDSWTSFKREFNHDMDELGQAFKDLAVNNAK